MPWVRLVLAISLDGRLAFPNGGKTTLGGFNDRQMLEEALAWSDGTLVGGGTLRAHKNTCLIHNPQLLKKRESEGRSKQPISVVVSSQKDFCANWPFFNQPIQKWIMSPEDALAETSESLKYDRKFCLKETWPSTLAQLEKAGLSRLVLLGGAQLVSSLLAVDQVDELQLTFTPKIIGGKYTWVSAEPTQLPQTLSQQNSWELKASKNLGESEFLLHYVRNRAIQSSGEIDIGKFKPGESKFLQNHYGI